MPYLKVFMATANRQQKAHFIRFDPKFTAVSSAIWSVFKFIFSAISYIFRLGQKPKEEIQTSIPSPKAVIKTLAKEDTFLSYGGFKWYSLYTPAALKIKNLKNYPKGTAVAFHNFEISIFGDLFEDQIQNIENSIDIIIAELKPDQMYVKEIHLLKDLGKYLDNNGVPDTDIIGFSMDNEGACLMHADAAADPDLCHRYLQQIISEEINRITIHAKSRDTLWNQSDSIKERLLHNREYHEADNKKAYGALRGKAIIDIDSPIAGGVYLGAPAREALHVDPESDLLNQIYKSMLLEIRKIKESLGIGFEEKVFQIAIAVSQKHLPHNSAAALNRLRQENRIITDGQMELDFFIHNETGDSEHAALLLAFLLEKLAIEQPNYLSGKISIDRNWIPGGGHAWVRYTRDKDNIYILDPIKDYQGRLDNYSSQRWAYERRSDLNNPRISRPL
jgi:hypothetical protein